MHNFKRDILHILQIFCVLFLPSFLLSHAKKPSAAGTKKEKVQRLLLRNRWTSWSALCFPSRTFPSPSFLLIFFLPVPSPINPFSPAHCTASPKTAPRTVCRSVGSLPAVAHVPGLCSMRSVRLDESCSEWLSSSSDIVLTVAHILPSVQPPACPPTHRSGPAHPAECDKLSYYG